MKNRLFLNPLEANSLNMRLRAKTFFFASKFLPPDVRTDLSVLYSFCRYVDDSVDRGSDRKLALILIDQVIHDLERKTSSIKEVAEFLALAISRNIPAAFAIELALGVKSDLFSVRKQSQDELLRYCYRVASTVGIMICYLLGLRESKAIAFGIDLGIAMQLTNIARDVLEDYANDRIYLPTDLISEKIIAQAFSGGLREQGETFEIIKQVIKLADVYYESAENGICYLPKFARLAVLVSSRAYRKIGQNIIKEKKNYFKKRISTSDIQKQICLAEAIFSLCTNPKYQRVNNCLSHQAELHRVLRGSPGFDRVYS